MSDHKNGYDPKCNGCLTLTYVTRAKTAESRLAALEAGIRAAVEPYLSPTAGPEAQGLADEILSLLPDKDTPDVV